MSRDNPTASVLDGFWAVTITGSVYRVLNRLDSKGWPIVRKVKGDLRSFSKSRVGSTLKGGQLVAISISRGVSLYSPPNRQTLEELNMVYRGGHTSPICALFLTRKDAVDCSNADNLKNWDERWLQPTTEVILRIGTDHPLFIPSMALPPSKLTD